MPAGRVAAGQATGGACAALGGCAQRQTGLWRHRRVELNDIVIEAGGVRVWLC
jgi:hypothetical protein